VPPHGCHIGQQSRDAGGCDARRARFELAGRRVGVARRGTGPAAVHGRWRSLRGRPASRGRHRRHRWRRPARSRVRRRVLHRAAAARGSLRDDSHAGRALDHARARRLHRRDHGHSRRGGRRRGHDRPERRGRVGRAVRPPRRSPDRRSERLYRSADALAGAAGERASAAPGGAAARRAGSACSTAGSGGAASGSADPVSGTFSRRQERALARSSARGRRGVASAGIVVDARVAGTCLACAKRPFREPAASPRVGDSRARRRAGRHGSHGARSPRLAETPTSDGANGHCDDDGAEPRTIARTETAPARAHWRLRRRASRAWSRRPTTRASPGPAPFGAAAAP
jgi:hypothetical protein